MFKQLSDIFGRRYEYKRKKQYSKQNSFKENESGFDFLGLVKNWESVVGEQLAKNTAPLKIQYKTLSILTRHSVYSHQLSYIQDAILDKILSIYPALRKDIKKIIFQTSETYFIERDGKEKIKIEKIHKNTIPKHNFSPEYIREKNLAYNEFKNIDDDEMLESLVSLKLQLKKKSNK